MLKGKSKEGGGMMPIETTIRQLRQARGLTQEQVARALGVSAPAVSKWETGDSLR